MTANEWEGRPPIDPYSPLPGVNVNGVDEREPYSKHKARERDTTHAVQLLDGAALAASLPDLEYLVREIGLVAGGGAPHLAAGYGFTGKTLTLQAMALSLAAGRPVWGAYLCRDRRRVLHVDLEQGDRLTRRRYQRLARAMGVDLAELGDGLSVAIMPSLALNDRCADQWRRLMEGRHLVVVDSLRAATGGQDENSSDIRAGLDMLGKASEATGCRPIVVHHARKPSEDAPAGQFSIRGSSAIFDAVDSAYVYGAGRDEPIQVEHVKARSHGEPVEPIALVISDVEIADDPKGGLRVQVHGVELVNERRQAHAESARQEQARRDAQSVRKAIEGHPGIGTRELRGVTRLSGDRVAAALADLGARVEVREERTGRARAATRHYLRGSAS